MSDEAQYTDDEIVASAFHFYDVALVEYWKEEGVEFDALKTRIEILTFELRVGESVWRLLRSLGMKYTEIRGAPLPPKLEAAINAKFFLPGYPIDFMGNKLLGFSVCDMYRIVDAIKNMPDDDAGILAYRGHIPPERKGEAASDYEEVEKYTGRFLPQEYFVKRNVHGIEIDAVDKDKVNKRIDEIVKELVALVDENVKFEIEPKASIRVIRRDESGSTLDKRTYSGDIPGTNALVLSECAIADFNITIPAEKVDDENAAVAVITNNLTGRSLQMKGISDGKKRLIKSGHNFTLHGHDMKTEWVLAIIEEKDDA